MYFLFRYILFLIFGVFTTVCSHAALVHDLELKKENFFVDERPFWGTFNSATEKSLWK